MPFPPEVIGYDPKPPKSYPPIGPQLSDFVFWFVVCFVAITSAASAILFASLAA